MTDEDSPATVELVRFSIKIWKKINFEPDRCQRLQLFSGEKKPSATVSVASSEHPSVVLMG